MGDAALNGCGEAEIRRYQAEGTTSASCWLASTDGGVVCRRQRLDV